MAQNAHMYKEEKMTFTIHNIDENIWSIEQHGVRAFLLVGEDNAILVDTCFGGDILSVCRSLTGNPITLITTHSDPDHIGCNSQFPSHYLHAAEFSRYAQKSGHSVDALPMQNGDIFTAGQFQLEVILIPGHTPGSVALLDRKHRFLISGDTVQSGCIFMHGDGRDLDAFRESIAMLENMRQDKVFDTILASHGDASLPADIITDHLILTDTVLDGTAVPVGPAPVWFPSTVKTYRYGRAQMYY